MASKATGEKFLTWLFGESIKKKGKILIWSIPSRASVFFTDISKAAGYCVRKCTNSDVYFGLGIIIKPPKKGRGKLEDIGGIAGFWADIDFGTKHKKPNIPPNQTAAMKVLDAVGMKPSILIHSGHGLQAHWLFHTPWLFSDERDRAKASKLSHRWVVTVRACAERFGWTVDAVQDLTRVLRVPGTVNRKGKLVEVKILSPADQPRRYDLDELERMMVDEVAVMKAAGSRTRAVLPKAEPVLPKATGIPIEVETLCKNDRKFRKTWERQRQDLTDQSPSGYDMALANMLAMAGCSDQTIADALLAWRQRHGLDVKKAMRRDYLMRTIGQARSAQGAEAAMSQVEQMATAGGESGNVAADREDALGKISQVLGIQIVRVVQHGRENSMYSMELADGTDISLGAARVILSSNSFRERLIDAIRVVIPQVKQDRWFKLVQVFLHAAELEENEESTRVGMITEWVESYLRETQVFDDTTWKEAVAVGAPFTRDGKLHVNVPSLLKFLRLRHLETFLTKHNLYDHLRLIKFAGVRVWAQVNQRASCRYYWTGPKDLRRRPEKS